MHLVWFKRDLRIHDHAPLAAAARAAREDGRAVLPIYIVEPDLLAAPDSAGQHWGFIGECLRELADALASLGSPLACLHGEATAVFQRLNAVQPITALYSHEETGNALTYARDLRVGAWARGAGVPWHEIPQTGVVRRLATRNAWATQWMARMTAPLATTPTALKCPPSGFLQAMHAGNAHGVGVLGECVARTPGLPPDKTHRQPGGMRAAQDTLVSFLSERGQWYRGSMSSPLSAADACSRLSPHLAYGTLSIRTVAQEVWALRSQLLALPAEQRPPGYLPSLKSFEGRLHWHCHFMQKLESEPEIEFRNVHRGFDDLREGEFDATRFQAWCVGETGFPMVDACMRMLRATGWLNFRMRAMLVSFASYQLWLHWREPALHLAREFLDYEPGIHYPQVQMQSGVTGINTIRMYNPVKQAQDHDAEGHFVRRWIPALRRVPTPWLFEPWSMPQAVQQQLSCVLGRDYPLPIVDNAQAMRFARERIWHVKARADVRDAAKAVYAKHGSRNPNREGKPPTKRVKAVSAQGTQSVQTGQTAQTEFDWGDDA
jgi:deoxyribodipyrimidine photo-lyase